MGDRVLIFRGKRRPQCLCRRRTVCESVKYGCSRLGKTIVQCTTSFFSLADIPPQDERFLGIHIFLRLYASNVYRHESSLASQVVVCYHE
jgi:hypothetical protein